MYITDDDFPKITSSTIKQTYGKGVTLLSSPLLLPFDTKNVQTMTAEASSNSNNLLVKNSLLGFNLTALTFLTTTTPSQNNPTAIVDDRQVPLFTLSCALFGVISLGILGTWAIIVHTFFADCCRRRWRRYQRRQKMARRKMAQKQQQLYYYQAIGPVDELDKTARQNVNTPTPGVLAARSHKTALEMHKFGPQAIINTNDNSTTASNNKQPLQLLRVPAPAEIQRQQMFLTQQHSWTLDDSDSDDGEVMNEEDELERFKQIQNASRRTSYSSQHSQSTVRRNNSNPSVKSLGESLMALAASNSKQRQSAIGELAASSLPSAAIFLRQQQETIVEPPKISISVPVPDNKNNNNNNATIISTITPSSSINKIQPTAILISQISQQNPYLPPVTSAVIVQTSGNVANNNNNSELKAPAPRQRAPPLGRCVPTVTIEDYDADYLPASDNSSNNSNHQNKARPEFV